jgi:AI-2 transport protein TqsA
VTAKISDIPVLLIIAAAFVVIVAMFFWGWVLGPIGMLLSVPLTMIAKIALASSDDTRWLAVLLE